MKIRKSLKIGSAVWPGVRPTTENGGVGRVRGGVPVPGGPRGEGGKTGCAQKKRYTDVVDYFAKTRQIIQY